MELNKENAIVSIASGTASGKKAGSEANRGVSTVSFQELVRSHSTSSDVFQGGNILPQAENFSQRPPSLPNENSTDSVKLITVGGGYSSNTFDLLIVGEQASEAEALTFAKESGLSTAAIDVIFNESKSPSAEASLPSSSDSPRLAAAGPPLIAEEGNTANLLLARAELSGARGMGLPSSSEGVSQELKGPAGERITATNSTGNRAELSGMGSVVLPSDSEGISKDLKAPILPRGDTTELLLRRSALTTLLGAVPEGDANSVSSEARAGLSYASNSEGYLRSQADLAKTLSSDRLSANGSAEVIVSERKEMSSVKSNAQEYLRNRTELFGERLRDSEGVIPPGSVVLKSGRARTEASLSMRNTKTADSAYEALASKAKFESILPGLPPLATTKDAPGQTLLTPSLSPDNLVFSGETRLSASTSGITGSEAAKSILNQSAVNQEGLSELRERFTARLSSDLAQRLTAGFKGGTHNLEFDLLPEKLGRIGVRMEYHEGKLEAMISSTSNVTREVLGENLPRLRELLVNSGVNVASLDIDSGSQKYSQQNSPSGDREFAAREGNTQESGVESERSQVLDFSDLNIDLWV